MAFQRKRFLKKLMKNNEKSVKNRKFEEKALLERTRNIPAKL
jgi:hypothetical protein